MPFQDLDVELDQAPEFKQLGLQPALAAVRDLSETPAPIDPNIEPHEAQTYQQEPISGVGRGGPTPDLTGSAVALLDPEAPSVLLSASARRPVSVDENEDNPSGQAWLAAGAFGGGVDATDGQTGGVGRAGLTVKVVAGVITPPALADGRVPPVLPPRVQAIRAGCFRSVR